MTRRLIFASLGAALLFGAAPAPPLLTFDGAFVTVKSMNAAAFAALPHVAVSGLEEHATAKANYTGVKLSVLLAAVGVPVGADVKGAPARSYVVVNASDRYTAVFAVGELERTVAQCDPILVDRVGGVPIPGNLGPLHIVAPCDETHARWVHEVTGFTVVTLPDARKQ